MAPLGPFPIGTSTVTVTAYDGLVQTSATAQITVTSNPNAASPVTLATERVSINRAGGQGDGPSFQPWPNLDGSVVAFASQAPSMDASTVDFQNADVFIRDRTAGSTTVLPDNSDLNVNNEYPRLSDDGR